MSSLINEFSWSKSRDNTFRECARKYYFQYYGYWGGWEKSAPDRTRQLYVLKQLKNRQMWAGEVVHNCLQRNLEGLRRGISPLPLEQILDLTRKLMRSDFRNSRDKRYWDNPKSCALLEHEYQLAISDEEWRQIADQAQLCLRNFFNSSTYRTLCSLPDQDIKEIEQFSSFEMEGTRIYVKLDLCCQRNGQIYIYDWKTGKSVPDSELQLACYALYAQAQWSVALTDCKLIEYNLLEDRLGHFVLSPDSLEDVRRYIAESVQKMRELLQDKRKNLAREEDFTQTQNFSTCRRCNFLRICRPELASNG